MVLMVYLYIFIICREVKRLPQQGFRVYALACKDPRTETAGECGGSSRLFFAVQFGCL